MNFAKPLPQYLVTRYHGWKATQYEDNKAWFKHLAAEGQHPRAMVISCCDSRVHITSIFGAETGEFFIHRNIANLVPPYAPSGNHHGTSAAIEYAVRNLDVAHLIIMGHSSCGGVSGCFDMCSGNAPELEEETSFLGRWMEILRPGFDRLNRQGTDAEKIRAFEHEGVIISLENLMTFPFVRDAVEAETLTLHGLWNDIGTGDLECYNSKTGEFYRI